MRMLALGLASLFAVACGGSSDPSAPEIVAGGGATGGGHLDGRLNVYVIDSVTLAPIAGAWVQLGDGAALGPGVATDATGLAKVDAKGKQSVTAAAPGHINQTWI